jgi:hypothetical protein
MLDGSGDHVSVYATACAQSCVMVKEIEKENTSLM